MKFEDFKKIRSSTSRPPKDMTDKSWQKYFQALRLLTNPCKDRFMVDRSKPFSVNGRRLSKGSDTQWYRYCQFINGILSEIRKGNYDYCFFINQVEDLLRFERDRLNAKWMPEYNCFQVWLD